MFCTVKLPYRFETTVLLGGFYGMRGPKLYVSWSTDYNTKELSQEESMVECLLLYGG